MVTKENILVLLKGNPPDAVRLTSEALMANAGHRRGIEAPAYSYMHLSSLYYFWLSVLQLTYLSSMQSWIVTQLCIVPKLSLAFGKAAGQRSAGPFHPTLA